MHMESPAMTTQISSFFDLLEMWKVMYWDILMIYIAAKKETKKG
jgi:hypothetical protein